LFDMEIWLKIKVARLLEYQLTGTATDYAFRLVLKPEKSIPECAKNVGTFPNEVRKGILRTAFASINIVNALPILNS